jgi:hypothetical protein
VGFFSRDRGVEAQAEVLAVELTKKGMRQTERRDSEFELRLRVDGREVRHKCHVPYDKVPRVGETLPVRVTDKGVRVEWDAVTGLTERARAAAATDDPAEKARALGFELRDDS